MLFEFIFAYLLAFLYGRKAPAALCCAALLTPARAVLIGEPGSGSTEAGLLLSILFGGALLILGMKSRNSALILTAVFSSLVLGTLAFSIDQCVSSNALAKEDFRCLGSLNRKKCNMTLVYSKQGMNGIEECFDFFECPDLKHRVNEIQSLFSKYGKTKDIRKSKRLINGLVSIIESESRSYTIRDVYRIKCIFDLIVARDYGIIDLIEEQWITGSVTDGSLLLWLTDKRDRMSIKIQQVLAADLSSRYSLRRCILVVAIACVIYLMVLVFANRVIRSNNVLVIAAVVLLGAFFIMM